MPALLSAPARERAPETAREPLPLPAADLSELAGLEREPLLLPLKAEPTCLRCYPGLPDDTVQERHCRICGCRAQGIPLPPAL